MEAKNVPVVSYKDLINIQDAIRDSIDEITISLDLGITSSPIKINSYQNSFTFLNGETYVFPTEFNPKEKICYALFDSSIFPLKLFSDFTNFYYKLVPTSWRPILRISATQMHKKAFLDYLETQNITGLVLDAGTGLGYSAIIASKTATRVISIEWDENVLEIATFNPHSKELFNSNKIELRIGDVTKEIETFEDYYFNSIIQDGGMPKSSGEFFSQKQCQELYRVMDRGGQLFFYLPQHGKSKGRDFGKEHLDRLIKAGFFVKIRYIEGSFAVLYKR